MDTENAIQVSPEELAAEQAGAVLPKEEELRAEIVADTGFDPEDADDKIKIDKLVAREMDGRKKLSDTIRTKINYRDKLKTASAHKPGTENQPKTGNADLSPNDVLAFVGAQITHPEDIKEATRVSKILGKSIPETLVDTTFLAILKTQQEHRASANASNTAGGRSGAAQPTDEEVLAKAIKGEIPAKGSADAERLFKARHGVSK